jgi:hypothetical protein
MRLLLVSSRCDSPPLHCKCHRRHVNWSRDSRLTMPSRTTFPEIACSAHPRKRTIERMVQKLRPVETSEPWSLAEEEDPANARLLLDVGLYVADLSLGCVWVSMDLGRWVIRLLKACSALPAKRDYFFARHYQTHAPETDSRLLDLLLASRFWEGEPPHDGLQQMRRPFALAVEGGGAMPPIPDRLGIAYEFDPVASPEHWLPLFPIELYEPDEDDADSERMQQPPDPCNGRAYPNAYPNERGLLLISVDVTGQNTAQPWALLA